MINFFKKNINVKILKLINTNSYYIGIFKLKDVVIFLKKKNKNRTNKLNIFNISKNKNSIFYFKLIQNHNIIKFKKKNKKEKIKEIRFGYSISKHDYFNKIKKIYFFFKKKYKIKIVIIPKGREYMNNKMFNNIYDDINNDIKNYYTLDSFIKRGKNTIIFYSIVKKNKIK